MGARARKGGTWRYDALWLDAQAMARWQLTRHAFYEGLDEDERAYLVAILSTEKKIETLQALLTLRDMKDPNRT